MEFSTDSESWRARQPNMGALPNSGIDQQLENHKDKAAHLVNGIHCFDVELIHTGKTIGMPFPPANQPKQWNYRCSLVHINGWHMP